MRFDRMETALEALSGHGEITLNDALNVFYDLCADIKDNEGRVIDKLPAKDEESAVTRLCWMGRTMMRIAGNLSLETVEEEKAGRLSKVLGEFAGMEADLEKTEKTILALKAQEKDLRSRQQELAGRFQKEAALKQECEKLKEEILKYEELKTPGLKAERENLESRLEELRDDEREKEELLERLKGELAERQTQKAELDETLEDLKEQDETARAQLEEKEDSYRKLKERIGTMDTSRKNLTEKIETLERTLDCGDVEKLSQLYEKRRQEAQEYQRQCQDLREKVREKEEELLRLRQDTAGETRQIQELAWKEESEKKSGEQALRDLQKRIEEARRRKKELLKDVEDQEEELAALTEWFESLEAAGYEKRLEDNQVRLQVMREAQAALMEEFSLILDMTAAEERDRLISYQKYFRDTMDQMETEMDRYLQCYGTVMKVFENGGNGL